jgi:hypothetical protein
VIKKNTKTVMYWMVFFFFSPLYEELNERGRTGSLAQVVEHLSTKCKALSSNPSIEGKKKKPRGKRGQENINSKITDFSHNCMKCK